MEFNYQQNLTFDEIKSLFFFIKTKPFKVVECDKNVGVIFMSQENYDFLCNKVLNDIETYEKINNNHGFDSGKFCSNFRSS